MLDIHLSPLLGSICLTIDKGFGILTTEWLPRLVEYETNLKSYPSIKSSAMNYDWYRERTKTYMAGQPYYDVGLEGTHFCSM